MRLHLTLGRNKKQQKTPRPYSLPDNFHAHLYPFFALDVTVPLARVFVVVSEGYAMAAELFPGEQNSLEILLVEDDQQLRTTLVDVLREEGYSVTAVSSGTEAMECCIDTQFDLIVTDIKTPGTDGLTALERAMGANPGMAGIVMTGYSTEEHATRAARLRVEDYLKKPFKFDDFMRTVDRLAQRKRERIEQEGKEAAFFALLKHTILQADPQAQSADLLERSLIALRAGLPFSSLNQREQLAAEVAAFASSTFGGDTDWWSTFARTAPPRIVGLLNGDGSNQLGDSVSELLARYQFHEPLSEASADDESDILTGSLLNLGLMLESSEHLAEADEAFENLLSQSKEPHECYPGHLGRARIARLQHRHADLVEQLDLAVLAAGKLGPLTHVQAQGRRAVLLARAGHEQAEKALQIALESAHRVKDSTSYALASLARERYLQGDFGTDLGKLHAFLSRPDQFESAVEESPWLLEAVLCLPQDVAETRRLAQKLVRACPRTYVEHMMHSQDPAILTNSLPYLVWLPESERETVKERLLGLDIAEVTAATHKTDSELPGGRSQGPRLRVFTFSGIRLFHDDEPLDLRRRKPLLVLIYLLCRNSSVAEDVLCETFWPGPETKARGSLRTALSLLRKMLATSSVQEPFLRDAAGIGLDTDVQVWFDHREFRALIEAGNGYRESNPSRAASHYRSALKLYQGPFLEGVYEDWALQLREQAETDVDEALQYLGLEFAKTQSWPEVLEYAGRGLRRDLLNQAFCELTMKALIQLERPQDALKAFEDCSEALARELGSEPSTDLLRLREMARLGI